MVEPKKTIPYLAEIFHSGLARYFRSESYKLNNACFMAAVLRDAGSKVSFIQGPSVDQLADMVVTREAAADGGRYVIGLHGVSRVTGISNVDNLKKMNTTELSDVMFIADKILRGGKEPEKGPREVVLPSRFNDDVTVPMTVTVEPILNSNTIFGTLDANINREKRMEFLGFLGLEKLPVPIDPPTLG